MDALKGAVTAIAASLLIAILFAYLFRIPIPLGGYIGPFGKFGIYDGNPLESLKMVLFAWAFFGMFGGFIILALLGAITGNMIGREYSASSSKNKNIVMWSAAISAVPVFVLSILDYIIGPW